MRSLLAPFLCLLIGCGSAGSTDSSSTPPDGDAGEGGSSGSAGSSGKGSAGKSTAGSGGSEASGSGGSGGSSAGSGGSGGSAGGGQGGAGAAGSGGSAGDGQSGSGGSGGSGGSAEACPVRPACDTPPPDPGPARDWNHTSTKITVTIGDPNHRGRDLFLNPDEDQWIIGKFAYGLDDDDIKDEEVDIYLLRNCGDSWEKLITVKTTEDNQHPTVEGVDDSGGRVYYKIPIEKRLGLGLHRVHMVVGGDLSTADLFLEVVDKGTPLFVSDVDGTLTTSENVEFVKLLQGTLPDTHVDAPKALGMLAQRGYHPMYITARPEWLTQRTRDFVKERGFPPGIIHTTTTLTGNIGGGAADYKTGELSMLAKKGLVPSWVFGNTDTDAQAYNNGGIQPVNHRIFYQFEDTMYGGRTIQEYTELLDEFSLLPPVCKSVQ